MAISTSMKAEIDVRPADWERDREALREIREAVFVREQGVPPELEWDGADPVARHVLARNAAGRPIATARLLPNGHIGRMAVLRQWRGQGVGAAVLSAVLEMARAQGLARVMLNAQTAAVPFYRRQGFTAEGGEFMDAGIPHRRMWHQLEERSHG
jgi:predicted GNAT family N-acyltransferase